MCWHVNPTPTYFPKCTHTVNIPVRPYIEWCANAENTGVQCYSVTQTSQGSSTNRRDLCPRCKEKKKKAPKKDDKDDKGGKGKKTSQTVVSRTVTGLFLILPEHDRCLILA